LLVAIRFFAIVDSQICSCYVKESETEVRNFGKVGVGKFWELGVGHFTSDLATLYECASGLKVFAYDIDIFFYKTEV